MRDKLTLLATIARAQVTRQVAKRRLSKRLRPGEVAPGAETAFQVATYFADEMVNLYQLRQWYGPLQALARQHPVVIITRDPATTLHLIDECPLPVVFAPRLTDIESFVDRHDLALVLYVNQNLRNFQMLRFARPAHVFVSHGESDKSYMASNQVKAYDRVFIAGDAAAERLAAGLMDFDVAKRAVRIGRPQVDVAEAAPALPRDARTTVLYAPTWEGDRASMHYGSVASHGPALVEALLRDRRFRIVYRPHPRSGAFDRAYGAASRRIIERIEAANAADPAARHMVDTETPFGWHLGCLDVCVADVSAVANDWLATCKPLVLTAPADSRAVLEPSRLLDVAALLPADEASGIVRVIDDAMGRPSREYTDVVRHYFGDTTPGAALQRFLDACDMLVRERSSKPG